MQGKHRQQDKDQREIAVRPASQAIRSDPGKRGRTMSAAVEDDGLEVERLMIMV